MRHRLVGQLIFAVDSLATFASSGQSPMRSPAPVCTDKSTSVDRFEDSLDNEQTGKLVKLAITCKARGIAVRMMAR